MDAERLTDADFSPAPPTAATDAGIDPSNFGGYPGWDAADSPSLAPEDAPEPGTEPSEPIAAAPIVPTDQALTPESESPEPLDVVPESEAEPQPTELEQRLAAVERERDAERERAAAYEQRERDRARSDLDAAANYEVQQLKARRAQATHEATARASTLQGAARNQFLNARLGEIEREYETGDARIAEIHAERLIAILHDDPRVRDGFYTTVIQEYGLPEEARAQLAALEPEIVDHYAPILKAQYDAIRARDEQIAQYQKNELIRSRQATGADAMGGAHRAAVPREPMTALNDADAAHAAYLNIGR